MVQPPQHLVGQDQPHDWKADSFQADPGCGPGGEKDTVYVKAARVVAGSSGRALLDFEAESPEFKSHLKSFFFYLSNQYRHLLNLVSLKSGMSGVMW